jgi:hypothetical protein
VLADGEAEDICLARELEAVAANISLVIGRGRSVGTDMAVLWDRTVFSSSSKSWNSAGFSTLRAPPLYSL